MKYTPHFIIINEQPGCTSRATLRSNEKPWKALATCTNTSGPIFAAAAVARKGGFGEHEVELVRCHPETWTEATNGYVLARRISNVTHIYRIIAR